MRKIVSVLSAAVLTLTLCACSSGSSTSSITVAGSTTCLPIAEIAAEGFKEETGIDVLVSGLGSSAGIEAVSAGTADIASSSRGLNADEQDLGLTPIVIAHDGIAVIVNDDNPVDNLSTEQLRDIYAGKITNWKDVGGEDKGIAVVGRDTSSGTYETWQEIIMKKERVSQRALVVASSGAMLTTVAKNKYAIGYDGIGYINDTVKPLMVNGKKGSAETALDGSYPIARFLYMFTKGWPSGEIMKFMNYMLGDEGQKVVVSTGFVPLRILK